MLISFYIGAYLIKDEQAQQFGGHTHIKDLMPEVYEKMKTEKDQEKLAYYISYIIINKLKESHGDTYLINSYPKLAFALGYLFANKPKSFIFLEDLSVR